MTGRAGFVSLIGRPNAGKSTLLNRLVGEKLSIVSPRPQTTRNRITGIKNIPGAQVVFVDTPGLFPADGKLGAFMLKTAHRAVEDVDLVCLVVDASAGDGPDRIVLDPLRGYSGPVFCVLNKTDRVRPKSRMLPLIETWRRSHPFTEIVPISATEGTYCDRLMALIVEKLPEHPPFFPADATSDQPETFYVAEMIREKIFYLTREEVPYAVAVRVEELTERENPACLYVRATVFVDGGRSELVRIDHFDITRPFDRVREDLERLAQAAWIIECVARLTAERDRHVALFALLVRSLRALESSRSPARVAICFGVRSIEALGHRPRLDACVECGRAYPFPRPAFGAGGLVCEACARAGEDALPV